MIPTPDAIESAAFASWPALDEQAFLGWRLRFAAGYTKRANSANCTPESVDLSPAEIAEVESRYRARDLAAIFRLTSVSAPENIDDVLARRGYRYTDPSLVMTAPLAGEPQSELPSVASDAEAWLRAFQEISGKLGPEQEIHLRMLRSIRGFCAFAVDSIGDQPVCCGLGVLADGQLGLFDVATSPRYRGRGMARRLCARLLAWGRRLGAQSAFLQVVGSNAVAIRLYEDLGFRRAYHYWYRVSSRPFVPGDRRHAPVAEALRASSPGGA